MQNATAAPRTCWTCHAPATQVGPCNLPLCDTHARPMSDTDQDRRDRAQTALYMGIELATMPDDPCQYCDGHGWLDIDEDGQEITDRPASRCDACDGTGQNR